MVLGSQDLIHAWLNDDLSESALHKLTQPYEGSDMVWYPVTPAMGKPAFNGPECVEEARISLFLTDGFVTCTWAQHGFTGFSVLFCWKFNGVCVKATSS